MNISLRAAITIVIAHLLGFLVAWALVGTQTTSFGMPVVYVLALWIFAVQWVVYIPSYIFQTEKYFDLTGSLTYISTVVGAVLLVGNISLQSAIVAAMVAVWAARLGLFLFKRISRDGKDGRFDEIKPNAFRFLAVWSLQGLWVLLTLASAFVILTTPSAELSLVWLCIGSAVWLVGFVIEVVADKQKNAFRKDPANKGRFINVGLWSWSRHPNYVGEITLWLGVAIIALPAMTGSQYVGLVSPLFVFLLLRFISGVPMLEKRADDKWSEDPEYLRYKEVTPVLFAWPKLKKNNEVASSQAG